MPYDGSTTIIDSTSEYNHKLCRRYSKARDTGVDFLRNYQYHSSSSLILNRGSLINKGLRPKGADLNNKK